MKPENAFDAGAAGSGCVLANTKYQFATAAFVIHIFCPFNMYSSPFRTAFVLIPERSSPFKKNLLKGMMALN